MIDSSAVLGIPQTRLQQTLFYKTLLCQRSKGSLSEAWNECEKLGWGTKCVDLETATSAALDVHVDWIAASRSQRLQAWSIR